MNTHAYIIDRYSSISPLTVDAVEGKLSYVTDEGYPEFNTLLPDIYKYSYNQVL